jgi:predicted DNA-binding transcriptional regulator
MNAVTAIEPAQASASAEGAEVSAYRIADKWKGAVHEGSGWVAIPMSLLRMQTKLGLTATDMMVLANLLVHWWDPARAVYPRSSVIAKRMGVTKRTVQRSTEKMIRKGLMDRVKLEDGKRGFQFTPLVDRLAKDIPLSFQMQVEEILDA